MASTGSRNRGQPVKDLFLGINVVFDRKTLGSHIHLCSNGSNPASVRINHTAPNLDTRLQAKISCGLLTQLANNLSCGQPVPVLLESAMHYFEVRDNLPFH